jgi:hypothetical protein
MKEEMRDIEESNERAETPTYVSPSDDPQFEYAFF